MKQIRTIFYQGIYNSQVQLAKYLPETQGFIATTGEKVTCRRGLDLIINPYIGREIDEIEPYKPTFSSWLNPLKIFSYLFGFIGNWANNIDIQPRVPSSECSTRFTLSEQSPKVEKVPKVPEVEEPSSVRTHYINLFKFNFGQDGDLANHYDKYIGCVNEYPDHDLILWGVSKGAATTLNALVKNNYETSKIKMVVLEGCFSDIESVFKHWVENRSYFDANFWLAKVFLWLLEKDLLRYLISYRMNKDHDPVHILSSVPHNVPIVFITSAIDIVVPASQTVELYEKLRETGHPNVHLLILKNSRHHAYMFDDEEDRAAYRDFIKDLYSKYGLATF